MMNQRLQFAAVYLSCHPERPRKLKPKPRAKESQRQKQKGTQEPNQSHRPRGRGHHHAMIIRMEMAVAMMTTRTWMKMKVQEMVERLMVRQLLFLKWSIALLMWRNWRWRMVMRKQPQVLGRLALVQLMRNLEVALVLYFGTAFT